MPSKGRKSKKIGSSTDSELNLIYAGYESFEVIIVSSNRLEIYKVLNSGCPFNMSHFRHWFSDLKKFYSCRVLLGDDYE